MLEIPIPPTPQLPVLWAWILTGAGLLVGTAMLLWGRHLHRAAVVLTAAGCGVALADPLAGNFGWDLVVLRVVLAVALAIAGLLAARAVWAILAATLAVMLTAGIFLLATIYRGGQTIATGAEAESAWSWFSETAQACFDALNQTTAMPLSIAVAFTVGGAVLVIMWIRPRAARVLMTSVVAAVVLMATLLLGAVRVGESLWQTAWKHPYVPAGGTAALILLGWIWQFTCQRRETRKEKEAKKEQTDSKNAKKTSRKDN